MITSAALQASASSNFQIRMISKLAWWIMNFDITGKSRLNLELHGFKVRMYFVSVGGVVRFDLPKDVNVIDRIRNGIPKDTLLVVERRGRKYYKVFGTKLLLGDEQISLLQPMVKSHDSLKNTAVLVPKDGLIIFRYSCTGFEKTPNEDVLWTINKISTLTTHD